MTDKTSPADTMDVNGRSFQAVRLLGKGKGGYSWLVSDHTGEYVLKQIHHEPCSYYTFGNKMESELRDYSTLHKLGISMPSLLDADFNQERILKEYIDGPTISELILKDQMKPDYQQQLEKMLEVLYPAGLNIDYYPTNFIVQNDRLFYIDYECNPLDEKWNFENWGVQYWSLTPQFLEHFDPEKRNESRKSR